MTIIPIDRLFMGNYHKFIRFFNITPSEPTIIRTGQLFIGLLMIVLAVSARAETWNYLAVSRIDWMEYGESAFKQARESNRPVFVFVYADWCKWCKKYELETLENPVIRERLADKWLPVFVDYDEHPNLSRQLGVKLVPTTLLLTPDANKLQRFYGVVGPQALADNLDHVYSSWQRGELPDSDFGDESTCCPLVPPD